jgi:pyruvate dehydrogenase E2 component (dihydrolipoamide acetyltransferase)
MLRAMIDPGAASPPAGVKGEVRLLAPQRSEQAVARRSAESRATVPDLELAAEVEVDHALALAAEHGCGLSAILMRACALALRDVPRANAAYRDGSFELYSRINIGVVVAGDDAYTIPTVFDADERSLSELAAELTRVTERALSGELSSPELSGATFTLWDLGPLAVARATPLVVAPQAAAVSTGAVREVALVRNAHIVAGRAITITLACDHRILYGTQAGRFLNRITTLIEEGTL